MKFWLSQCHRLISILSCLKPHKLEDSDTSDRPHSVCGIVIIAAVITLFVCQQTCNEGCDSVSLLSVWSLQHLCVCFFPASLCISPTARSCLQTKTPSVQKTSQLMEKHKNRFFIWIKGNNNQTMYVNTPCSSLSGNIYSFHLELYKDTWMRKGQCRTRCPLTKIMCDVEAWSRGRLLKSIYFWLWTLWRTLYFIMVTYMINTY